MINLIRRIFGTRIDVTVEHINKGLNKTWTKSPVALAIQEKLDAKYGNIITNYYGSLILRSKKEIWVTRHFSIYTNKRSGFCNGNWGLETPLPKKVSDFIDKFDYDGTGEPFSFYYII